MSDVTHLNAVRAEREDDNRLISPAEALRVLAREIESGAYECNGLVVLTLDNEGNNFDVGIRASQLNASTLVTMFEAAKAIVLRDMGYLAK